ncbi:MAG: hypothetical protein AB1414_14705 [bacterium]
MNCFATAIGSLPHRDIEKTITLILDNLPDVPIWPQLPQLSFKENMYLQYSENLPCLIWDEENQRIFFETTKDVESQLEKFYQNYLDKEIEYFKIGEDYAAGFYAMLRYLKKQMPAGIKFIKGQITGPISFGLTVPDETKRAIIYNEQLFDTIIKGLAMKSVWQITKLNDLNLPIIIFIDEPYLSAFGSAYISLSKETIVSSLNEVIKTIKENSNALVGIHCCGNTDWSVLMETSVDIVNFDAYEFILNLALYPEELTVFLNRGGTLAWGIVPSSEEILNENVHTLFRRFTEGIELLASKLVSQDIPKDLLLKNLFITPSCGMGSLSEDITERILKTTFELTNMIRE